MGISPRRGSPCHKSLSTYFPGALPATALFKRVRGVLETGYGIRRERTTFGCSLCPDDVSARPGGFWAQMRAHWGEVVPLGGLGGAPFVGRMGFEAFLARVPKGRDAVLLFGPHVGILPSGEVGKYLAEGEQQPVPACRACVAAFEHCLAQQGNGAAPVEDPLDMQQAWLCSQLAPHAEDIAKAKAPMAALAYQSYDLVAKKFFALLDSQAPTGRVALIGGVQISMSDGCEDHFLPIDFEVLQQGEQPRDHMDTFNKW